MKRTAIAVGVASRQRRELAAKLIGLRFGRLLVLAVCPERHKRAGLRLFVRCDCGTEKAVDKADVLRRLRSCGCLIADNNRRTKRTHGKTDTPVHHSWRSMHARCYSPKNISYKYYGAIGVTVCERWHVFEAFLADMGEPKAGESIDRINPYGNYEPKNCRWATAKEQRANQRKRRHGCCA